ncbi:MAG: Maf family protein, partial [Acidobacteria bacterium]|nr:Maf family protein [Acidobacteriota bacterium]
MDVYTYLTRRRLVLASASPRRRDLLAAARLDCRIVAADIAEVRGDGESPEAYVRRLAWEKAHAVEAG